MLTNVRIVLVDTSHPGNIGATARAMKNMGLSQLYLVTPQAFPYHSATIRAAGADDILANAKVVSNLSDAVGQCHSIFGMSARIRSLPIPLLNPRECVQHVVTHPSHSIALVFGREKSGLSNEELALCHYHVHIPTEPNFSSLNLAAAVTVMVYELRMTIEQQLSMQQQPEQAVTLATHEQLTGYYNHLEATLAQIGFLDPKQPKRLMQRLARLYNRAALDETEVNILRGILSAVDRYTQSQ